MKPSGASLAKLSSPRIHDALRRERLFARLDVAVQRPITWIYGPPGSGKTTLVASYLEARSRPHHWYRMDNGDADPASFFHFLSEFDQNQQRRRAPPLTPDLLPDLGGYCRRFFRDLFSAVGSPSCLVFDDAQSVDADEFCRILHIAAEEAPIGAVIVIISRQPPSAAPLARAIAHQQVATLGWPELMLTEDESLAIARRHGVEDAARVRTLQTHTNGWVTGLVLLLADRSGAAPLMAEDDQRQTVLQGYFEQEILHRLDPATRRLLVWTALFDSFTPSMATALAQDSSAPERLDAVYNAQYFVARQSGAEPVYRYHDLFREFLTDQTRRSLTEVAYQELCARAASLVESNDDPDHALDLYARAERPAEIARLIREHGGQLSAAGRLRTLARWTSHLPDTWWPRDPWIAYWSGIAASITDLDAARTRFEIAYEVFTALGDRPGQFHAAVAAIENIVARLGNYREFDPWIEALEEPLSGADFSADTTVTLRAWYAFLFAVLARRLDHPLLPKGVAWMQRVLADGQLTPSEAVSAGVILIYYACSASDNVLGPAVVARVRPVADREDIPPVTRWLWNNWLGLYRLWRLEYADATVCWENCFAISRQYGFAALDFLTHINMTMVDIAEDRLSVADQRLREIRQAALGGQQLAQACFWLGELFSRLYQDKHADLPQAMEGFLVSAHEAGMFMLEMLAITDVAAVHMIRNETERARELVALARSMRAGTVASQFDGQIAGLSAALAFRDGDLEAARRHLTTTLELFSHSGSCGCLMWVRTGFSTLFAEAFSAGIRPQLLRDLIRQHQVPPPSRSTASWPWPVRIRAFGNLEIEVDGRSLKADGKSRHTVLALLKALLAEGGTEASADTIADCLWPDVDGDAAQSNLRGTVKRLRELLGHPDSVRTYDGKLSLNPRICWVDRWALDDLAAAIRTGAPDSVAAAREKGGLIFDLYRGPLLNAEAAPWLIQPRERERSRFLALVAQVSTQLEASGDAATAGIWRDRALDLHPEASRPGSPAVLHRLTSQPASPLPSLGK